MNIQEFITNAEEIYHKHFPNSKTIVVLQKGYATDSIKIKSFLAGNESELICGYWENDPFNISFEIDLETKVQDHDFELNYNCVLAGTGNTFLVAPSESSNLAFASERVNYKRTTGEGDRLIQALDKFYARLRKQFDNAGNENRLDSTHAELISQK